jgi:hypothetical protein
VGGVEETITVSGASPIVDVQTVAKRTVVTRDPGAAYGTTGANWLAPQAMLPGRLVRFSGPLSF